MHIFFAAGRHREATSGAASLADAGQMVVVRDPDDESEWQYLGNPEVATRTSLGEVVARFIKDCSRPDGSLDPECRVVAQQVRDALLAAARQMDGLLALPGGK